MHDPGAEVPPVETVTLEKIKHAVVTHIDLDVLTNPVNVDVSIDHATRAMVIQLQTYVAGSKMTEAVVSLPASAWDYIKRDYMPRWFSRRWPPRMETYTMTAHELYPRVKMPEFDPVVRISKQRINNCNE